MSSSNLRIVFKKITWLKKRYFAVIMDRDLCNNKMTQYFSTKTMNKLTLSAGSNVYSTLELNETCYKAVKLCIN